MPKKPNLISFDLCPFVQRSVITLLEKDVDFEITYIDLANPPAWFLNISPFGKVPALRIGEATLFESAVINEYLDEINPPSMHPAEPLKKALNRSWIEFASELIGTQYHLMISKTEDEFELHQSDIIKKINQLEILLGMGPYFNGNDFCLIDAAFAPVFTRFDLLEKRTPMALFDGTPKVAEWAANITKRTSVIKSVVPDFEQRLFNYIRDHADYSALFFATQDEH